MSLRVSYHAHGERSWSCLLQVASVLVDTTPSRVGLTITLRLLLRFVLVQSGQFFNDLSGFCRISWIRSKVATDNEVFRNWLMKGVLMNDKVHLRFWWVKAVNALELGWAMFLDIMSSQLFNISGFSKTIAAFQHVSAVQDMRMEMRWEGLRAVRWEGAHRAHALE